MQTEKLMDIDTRLNKLTEVDKNLMEILSLLKIIFSGYCREKQYGKSRIEDFYKRYDRNSEEIYFIINQQLSYLEKMCVGAEHQGSTFNIQQQSELTKTRTEMLRIKLKMINRLAANFNSEASTYGNSGKNPTLSLTAKKILKSLELGVNDEKVVASSTTSEDTIDDDICFDSENSTASVNDD